MVRAAAKSARAVVGRNFRFKIIRWLSDLSKLGLFVSIANARLALAQLETFRVPRYNMVNVYRMKQLPVRTGCARWSTKLRAEMSLSYQILLPNPSNCSPPCWAVAPPGARYRWR